MPQTFTRNKEGKTCYKKEEDFLGPFYPLEGDKQIFFPFQVTREGTLILMLLAKLDTVSSYGVQSRTAELRVLPPTLPRTSGEDTAAQGLL